MAKQNPSDDTEVDLESTAIDIEEIADTARKTFRFGDKLKDQKFRHGRVTLFMDMEAVDDYHELNTRAQAMIDSAGNIDLNKPGGPERHQSILDAYNKLEIEVEEARARMLKSALVVYLHSWPNVAQKVARRKTREKFNSEITGMVPDDKIEEANTYLDMQLFGASVVKMVDATGAVDDLSPYKKGKKIIHPRETVGQQLSEQLHPSQWDRLYTAYQKLTLTDQIGSAATDEPGF